ncbi:MAG: hypothetical protein AAF413_03015 [Patescibacteria group bacterium]
MKYLAGIVPGSLPILRKDINARPKEELNIIWHDDSMLMIESNLPQTKLLGISYFTNLYQAVEPGATRNMTGSYRLNYLRDGSPVKMPTNASAHLDEINANKKLMSETHRADHHFVIHERPNLEPTVSIKLSGSTPSEDGRLSPQVAQILCMYAGLKHKHTLLDPFAGTGAIPYQAATSFGVTDITASDPDASINRFDHTYITWISKDVSEISGSIKSESIDKIITDPPWGNYRDQSDAHLHELYSLLLDLSMHALKPGGVLVVLTGWAGFEELNTNQMEHISDLSILVNGKKATIHKLRKPS